MPQLHWFRSDLRIRDNSALHAAAASGDGPVVGFYVISPGDWARHHTAAVRVDFTLRTLAVLSADLARLNIPLLIRAAARPGEVAKTVVDTARQIKAGHIHFNSEYELHEAKRDGDVAELAARHGIGVHAQHDQCILEPGSVLTAGGTGGPFTVFTPFKKRWFAVLAERTPDLRSAREVAAPKKQAPTAIASDVVPDSVAGFVSTVPASLWPAGEAPAAARLEAFIAGAIHKYKDQRNQPAIEGTSALSPYLAAGVISPRTCLFAAAAANGGKLEGGSVGAATWISELVWREFYKHIVVAFPRVVMGRAFKPATDNIKWHYDEAKFNAWREGRTGFPIVDAAMRQLLATGWMHNRLRMIVAMFLTKDLFFDWRLGERHFMSHLIDGDLAANNGGWQWSASTGTDAAPYFRIFNPITQSRNCDPEGEFIRRYVPELRSIEGDAVHDPNDDLPPLARARLDYPSKIADRAKVKETVLSAFKGIASTD